MKTVTRIEMADNNHVYNIGFGKDLTIIEDDGEFIITDSGDNEGELYRAIKKEWAEEELVNYAIDQHLVIKGWGEQSGKKFWQLPEEIQQEIIKAAQSTH